MAGKVYSNEQIGEFLEIAAEIGITRTMRQLGYPGSWGTAQRWVQAAGIEVPLDEIKAKSAQMHDWYQTEDMLLVAQEGIMRTHLTLQRDDLTPDEHKKMAEAFQKYANTWLLLQGKANSINENRVRDSSDLAIMDLLNEEKMRNSLLEEEEAKN